MGGLILTAIIISLLLFLAVAVTPIALAGIVGYVGYRLYSESPARAEARAKAETMALYDAAIAQSQTLSDEEIDKGLAAA
jgi:hypothetical protein